MYYGYRRPRLQKTKIIEKTKTPKLRDFRNLTLSKLLKIKAFYDAYQSNEQERQAAAQRKKIWQESYDRKRELHQKYDHDTQKMEAEIKEIEQKRYDIYCQFPKEGFFAGLIRVGRRLRVNSTRFGKFVVIENDQTKMLADKLADVERQYERAKKLLETRRNSPNPYPNPDYNFSIKENNKNLVGASRTFSIRGMRYEVSVSDIQIADLDNCIHAQREKSSRIDDLKARAATNELETRNLAQAHRRKIDKQLSLFKNCPYCDNPNFSQDPHLDHIYPVSKGGQSRIKNLVFVCSSCNQRKRDLTLAAFINKYELNSLKIYERLHLLSKEF
jgi:5-methylcytosine-specific restriction endonuclease McrA